MPRIVINGWGRIARTALKILRDVKEIEVAAADDLVPVDNLAYLGPVLGSVP